MSTTPIDPATTPPAAPVAAVTPAADPAQDAAAAKAEADAARAAGDDLAAIKAEARKWEAQAKANSDAAAKLAEIEEASKTEAQKQADRTATLEAKVAEYETKEQVAAWKAEVAEATGVPAVALAGSTKEEIEAHATTLKPLIEAAGTPQAPGVVPTIGKTPQAPPNIPLGEQIAAAEREVLSATRGTPEHRAATEKVMALKGMQLREAATK